MSGFSVDRIGGDDAFVGNQEDREVEIVLEAVEVIGDLGDGAGGLLGHSGRSCRQDRGEADRGCCDVFHVADPFPLI